MPTSHRLRKHADYQHAYSHSSKQSGRQLTMFFAARTLERRSATAGARVGLTVPKAVGKAHERNRIKRRMREIVRTQLGLLCSPVDVIVHPRRSAMTVDFLALQLETAELFARIQATMERRGGAPFPHRPKPERATGRRRQSPLPLSSAGKSAGDGTGSSRRPQ